MNENEDFVWEVAKWSPLIIAYPFLWSYGVWGLVPSFVVLSIEIWIIYKLLKGVKK